GPLSKIMLNSCRYQNGDKELYNKSRVAIKLGDPFEPSSFYVLSLYRVRLIIYQGAILFSHTEGANDYKTDGERVLQLQDCTGDTDNNDQLIHQGTVEK
ncbi:MAG: hypothetical protein V6Z82_05035, partial [Flavobacteriales bacterium]